MWVTYMSLIVHLVVGELDSVKADDLTHPRLSCARGVRVHVEPRRDAGVIRVSSHHPLRAVVHIPAWRKARVSKRKKQQQQELKKNRRSPVTFGVHGHDVHRDIILLARVQIAHLDAHRRKHSPDERRGKITREKSCLISLMKAA